VQNRECIIQKQWKNELYKYISAIIKNNGHKMLSINGMPDHVHLLFGMRPAQSLSDLMQDIKASSSKWINDRKFVKSKFSWQEGYGAFAYSKSQLPRVIQYIERQEQHHKKKTFTEEYKEFLQRFEIEYNERFVFKPVEY
jgi:putative transposase